VSAPETGDVKVETQTPDVTVHVGPREGKVVLAFGKPGAAGGRSVTLSPEQAEMVLHALGLAVARISEEARLKAEERAGLSGQLLEQEVRLRGS
jgi:hypothetical protein